MSPSMTRLLALFLCLTPTALLPASAEASPVVVELFASQNCQACPRAHRTLDRVSRENDDVLILTWSVDYWDYLGAPDPMAMPEAKARQAAYADQMELRAPYTPQSVYDGVKQCPATNRRRVLQNIEARRDTRPDLAPQLTQTETGIEITGADPESFDLHVVEYLSAEANQTDMVNPVISTRVISDWDPTSGTVDLSCTYTCAAILQEPGHGEIHATLVLN
ncbi:MAG: DUF1223 domain-containing protein [Henriciella sp.]|nr:DUF1223 domain-containing protein [Henriciella sp.]